MAVWSDEILAALTVVYLVFYREILLVVKWVSLMVELLVEKMVVMKVYDSLVVLLVV